MAVGDEGAGLTFVRRYQHRLFGIALGMVGDVGLAEDVAQEAFIWIIRHAAVFDARRGSVSRWALAITRHLAIDALRTRRGIPTRPNDQVFLELTSPDCQPGDAALMSDTVGRARVALFDLSVEQRRAVVLAAIYGRTAREVADTERIALGTAKSRIRTGMSKLRHALIVAEAS
jgi:RNA polymerase sigma factor (sigma-70 family)